MAPRRKAQTKRRIESYDHRDKERLNNPPVGLVTPDTDKERSGSEKVDDDRGGAESQVYGRKLDAG